MTVLFKAIFFILMYVCSTAKATDIENARLIVQDSISTIKEILTKKISQEEKKKDFVDLIDKKIDTQWLSGFILGKNRENLNKDQMEQFQKDYKKFALDLYYNALTYISDKEVTITSSTEQPNNKFYVEGFIISKENGKKVLFEIRLHNSNNKLLIYDIITSGISLAISQRSEIISAIQKDGLNKLLEAIHNHN